MAHNGRMQILQLLICGDQKHQPLALPQHAVAQVQQSGQRLPVPMSRVQGGKLACVLQDDQTPLAGTLFCLGRFAGL